MGWVVNLQTITHLTCELNRLILLITHSNGLIKYPILIHANCELSRLTRELMLGSRRKAQRAHKKKINKTKLKNIKFNVVRLLQYTSMTFKKG